MEDYAIKRDELPKGLTLGEYVKLKGLTDNNWLLVFDAWSNKLLTGVRADGLMSGEKDYYLVTVCNYIFPQYASHSERPYYIVVEISKTPINFNPIVYTETEVSAEDAEEQENSEFIEEDKQEFEELYESVAIPLCVFQLMQDKVNDYIDDNDIMEKYGDKEIPCGVMVKIEHNMSKPSYKCEIYDDSGEEAEKRISKIEPLTPLERTVFEAIEDCFKNFRHYLKKSDEVSKDEPEGDFDSYSSVVEEQIEYFTEQSSIETLKANFLQDLISKAGLDETYQSWLRERKKQEAVTVI